MKRILALVKIPFDGSNEEVLKRFSEKIVRLVTIILLSKMGGESSIYQCGICQSYTCGICMEDFSEEGVVKHCEGKHIFCRGCLDTWNSTNNQYNKSLSTTEHYSNDSTTRNIPELIYKIKTNCPICRKEIRLIDDEFGENYTGTITKKIPCYGGKYVVECSYLNGKKHGTYKRSHLSSGIVIATCEFVNGRIQGTYTVYDYFLINSNTVKYYKYCEIPYVDGNIDGIARFWYASGLLFEEKSYQAGVKHGESKKWHPIGTLKELYIHQHGNILSTKEWYENGNLRIELNYNPLIKGQIHGVQKGWHYRGSLKEICHYNYGIKCGIHQKFDQGGNLVKEENFGPVDHN